MSCVNDRKKTVSTGFSLRDTNITKGIAIMILIIHHCFMAKTRYKGYEISFWPFPGDLFERIAVYGKICVPTFAFLSAYGMTLSLMKIKNHYPKEAAKVSLRRLLKLYSGYWFAYALCYAGCFWLSPGRLNGLEKEGIWFFNLLIDLLGFGSLHHKLTLLETFWYMSLAILQILLIPFLYSLCDKVHPFISIALMIVVSRVTHLQGRFGNYNYLLLTAAGILSARADLWGRIRRLGEQGAPGKALIWKVGKAVLALPALYASYRIFHYCYHTVNQDISMTVCAMVVVYTVAVVWSRIPYFSEVLAFLGFYSMNIYYIHNFYRINWLHREIFSLHYWWAVAGALLAVSLVSAIAVEWFKKRIGYTSAVNQAADGILRL